MSLCLENRYFSVKDSMKTLSTKCTLITQHRKDMKIFPNSDKHSWVLNAKVLHIFSFKQNLNVDARFCDSISMFCSIIY